jgi:hypothetical protein
MNFREMVLIPMEEYKRHSQHDVNVKSTPTPMQKELHSITTDYGANLPDDQRLKLQGSIIDKYTNPLKPSLQDPQQSLFLRIFESFNAANKRRSLQVFHHLVAYFKNNPKWNDLGQLYNENNEPIIGSSIVDLIDAVTTSSSKSTRIPIGFDDFINYLNESNMPRNFLSVPGIRKINKQTPDLKLEESGYLPDRNLDASFTTPPSWDRLG